MRVQPCKTQGKAAGVYSLEVESPGRRTKTVERVDSMRAHCRQGREANSSRLQRRDLVAVFSREALKARIS